MSKAMRQMPERSGRVCVAQGEAVRDHISDEACGPLPEHPDTGSAKSMAGTGGLLAAAMIRENLQAAFKRVKANKGAAGVDGFDIGQTAELLRTSWLGIPTVTDRLIQQALLQVLQPLIDPSFSEHSHGFRPVRRAHDAVRAA